MNGEKFKFGDILENGWAGEGNPHKRGVYLWTFVRTGRLNPGKYSKVRHDDGKLGEWPIDAKSKTSIVGTIFDVYQSEIEALKALLAEADQHIITIMSAIAGGNADAGQRFAANDPIVIKIRAALTGGDNG
jgi:hypothetical protein